MKVQNKQNMSKFVCIHVPQILLWLFHCMWRLKYESEWGIRKFVFFCRNYMNDSFRTEVFVRFQPDTIACACIYLAARQLQVCKGYIFSAVFYANSFNHSYKIILEFVSVKSMGTKVLRNILNVEMFDCITLMKLPLH